VLYILALCAKEMAVSFPLVLLALSSAALTDNPDSLNYQYINRLSPNLQVMLVPGDSPFLLPFPSTLSPTPTPTVTVPTPAQPAP